MPVHDERINLFIGTGQLLIAGLLWFGVDAKVLGRFVPKMNLRNKWVGILIFGGLAFSAAGFYRTIPEATDAANIESHIRSWLDNFRLAVQNYPSEDSFFRIIVSRENGNKITVARFKERDRYLVLQGTIAPSQSDSAELAQLPSNQAELLRDEMVAEMARTRIVFSNISLPFGSVTLEKRIPITPALTEDVFIERLDEMDSAMLLFRDTVTIALSRYKSTHPPQ